MTNAIFAIAQALLERENELEHMLSIFVREEVISWHHQYQKPPAEGGPKHWTLRNIKSIVQRTRLLSCASVTEQVGTFSRDAFVHATARPWADLDFSNPLFFSHGSARSLRTKPSCSWSLRRRTQAT